MLAGKVGCRRGSTSLTLAGFGCNYICARCCQPWCSCRDQGCHMAEMRRCLAAWLKCVATIERRGRRAGLSWADEPTQVGRQAGQVQQQQQQLPLANLLDKRRRHCLMHSLWTASQLGTCLPNNLYLMNAQHRVSVCIALYLFM